MPTHWIDRILLMNAAIVEAQARLDAQTRLDAQARLDVQTDRGQGTAQAARRLSSYRHSLDRLRAMQADLLREPCGGQDAHEGEDAHRGEDARR